MYGVGQLRAPLPARHSVRPGGTRGWHTVAVKGSQGVKSVVDEQKRERGLHAGASCTVSAKPLSQSPASAGIGIVTWHEYSVSQPNDIGRQLAADRFRAPPATQAVP